MIRISDKFRLLGANFLGHGLRIVTTLIVARYVPPGENGKYALILAVAGFVTALSDFTIPQSLIKLRDFPEEVLVDTATALATLLYILYGVVTVIGGFYLARKLEDPRLWKVGILVAVTGMITAQYDLKLAFLNRTLQFKAESQQNMILALATAVSGIIFAVSGLGVYALALQLFFGQLAANLVIYARLPPRFPKRASIAAAKRFIQLGTPVSMSSYVGNVEGNIVQVAISSRFGVAADGLWVKSLSVQQLFAQNLMTGFERVAYPLICNSAHDPERMRMLYKRSLVTMAIASGLFTAVLFANSNAIVLVGLGKTWAAAGPLLRITALAIPSGAIGVTAMMMSLALGTTKTQLKASIANLIVFLPLVYVFRRYGMSGLAGVWAVFRYFIGLTVLITATHMIHTGLRAVARELALLAIASAGAAAIMCLMNRLMPGDWLEVCRLCISGGIGTLVYGALVWLMLRESLEYAMTMALGRKRDGRDPSESPPHVSPILPVESPAFIAAATGLSADASEQRPLPPT